MTSPLISVQELAAKLGDPGLRIVDGSWHLDGRDGRPDFEAARIPSAVFFDLEASSDPDSPLPHMLPEARAFGRRMETLGLSKTDDIVVYDTVGVRSSARVWWMLRTFGARSVRVLDGGLPAWRKAGQAVESEPRDMPVPGRFEASLDRFAVASLDDVRRALDGGDQVLDARSAERFRGTAPEPRAGLRSGHMPGALNLPFPEVLTAEGRVRSPGELRGVFEAAGVDLTRPVVTSCGSGVTAAILTLALETLGAPSRLYDGSWAEWGGRDDTPVEVD